MLLIRYPKVYGIPPGIAQNPVYTKSLATITVWGGGRNRVFIGLRVKKTIPQTQYALFISVFLKSYARFCRKRRI